MQYHVRRWECSRWKAGMKSGIKLHSGDVGGGDTIVVANQNEGMRRWATTKLFSTCAFICLFVLLFLLLVSSICLPYIDTNIHFLCIIVYFFWWCSDVCWSRGWNNGHMTSCIEALSFNFFCASFFAPSSAMRYFLIVYLYVFSSSSK